MKLNQEVHGNNLDYRNMLVHRAITGLMLPHVPLRPILGFRKTFYDDKQNGNKSYETSQSNTKEGQ